MTSRDIHLHTHPMVLRSCGAGRRCRWTQFLSIGTPWMPHNALEWHVCVQMNVTRIWFCRTRLCLSDYASFGPALSGITHLPHLAFHQASLFHKLFGQLVLHCVNLGNVNDGTAAGINALRRLKIKRCRELALSLSLRLTFAWVCVAVRAIPAWMNCTKAIRSKCAS